MVGAATYKVLRDLVAPAKPGTKPLEELLQKLEQHYSPRRSEIFQRFVFILVSGSLVKLLLRSSPDCAHCLNTVLLEILWMS